MIMALVLVYDIVDLKDGPTRLKHLVYYILVGLENGVLLGIWFKFSIGEDVYWFQKPLVEELLVILFPCSFVAGITFMCIYYRFFHPEGKMPDMTKIANVF